MTNTPPKTPDDDRNKRTKPEDRLEPGRGQQTRDNVNPAIPSAPPGTGGIVDPNTLGMPQAGGGAPNVSKAAAPGQVEDTGSINEPPGSNVVPDQPPTTPPTTPAPEPEVQPLPSNDELHGMRRSDLDELAKMRGVDVSGASNKDEVIELLRKDARKRK